MDNIVTIVLGILLTTSEILPYIKQIKSNGILEFFTNTIVEIVRFKLNSLHIPDNSHETRPLLENDTYTDTYSNYTIDQNLNFSSNLNENLKSNDDINININSENVLLKFNTSNVQISFDVNDKVEINKNSDIINEKKLTKIFLFIICIMSSNKARDFNRTRDDSCAIQRRNYDNDKKLKFMTTNHVDLLEAKEKLNFYGMTIRDHLFVPSEEIDKDSFLRYGKDGGVMTNYNIKNIFGQLPLATMPNR